MTRLQNMLYNAVCARFGADPAVFQLRQPVNPLPLTDTALWAVEDVVPPFALTFNTGKHQAARFSAEYRALVTARHPVAPAEFHGTVDGLLALLALSLGTVFEFDSVTTSADVGGAWAAAADPPVFGLWPGLDDAHPVNVAFAASAVTVAGACDSYAVWTAVPGDWYDSATLNAFYTAATSQEWDEFFGVDGRLARAIGSLLVLDGVRLTVTSDVRLTTAQRELVAAHVADGTWPLFAAGGVAENAVGFTEQGMTLTTTVPAGHPLVLGYNVLGIGRYLGHEHVGRQYQR